MQNNPERCDPLKKLAKILSGYTKSQDHAVIEDFVTVYSTDPNYSRGKLTIGQLRRLLHAAKD